MERLSQKIAAHALKASQKGRFGLAYSDWKVGISSKKDIKNRIAELHHPHKIRYFKQWSSYSGVNAEQIRHRLEFNYGLTICRNSEINEMGTWVYIYHLGV